MEQNENRMYSSFQPFQIMLKSKCSDLEAGSNMPRDWTIAACSTSAWLGQTRALGNARSSKSQASHRNRCANDSGDIQYSYDCNFHVHLTVHDDSRMAQLPCKVLDGGTGHLLKARGVENLVQNLRYDQLFLAGSLANLQWPEVVQEVHREYIAAGVDVITCNNFACTSYSLSKINAAETAGDLIAAAARLAREVANQAERPVLVAGTQT